MLSLNTHNTPLTARAYYMTPLKCYRIKKKVLGWAEIQLGGVSCKQLTIRQKHQELSIHPSSKLPQLWFLNMAYELDEQKKIGLGLIGFGILFTFLAIILFFDRGLLALGNILWLAGVALMLGWHSTLQLFKMNYKGTVSFMLGIFLIFVRWPVLGIIVEIYGCIVLFGGFWPSVKVFLFQIPVFGWILQYPALLLDHFRR